MRPRVFNAVLEVALATLEAGQHGHPGRSVGGLPSSTGRPT
jgi:hypothetical protein